MRIFRPKHPISQLQSHRVYYGFVHSPDPDGSVIDEALVIFMQAPHSYTREDVVEIQCHGGPAVTRKVLEAVLFCGAREAEPGEFTRRAFLNGRIDLSQAEAVLELITANTELQRQAAIGALSGNMSRSIEAIRHEAIGFLAQMEAELDFPEEDLPSHSFEALAHILSEKVLAPIDSLIESYATRHVVRDGVRVVMVGRPNAGKSSLFNALLGSSRVLVSPVPGTTRDSIEENLDIDGLLVTLVDTAGLREQTSDAIEAMGMDITQKEIERAHHLLVLMDCTQPLTDEDFHILKSIKAACPLTLLLNKVDLLDDYPFESFDPQKLLEQLPIVSQIRDFLWQRGGFSPFFLPISAKTGLGLEALKRRIKDASLGSEMIQSDFPVPTLRQKDVLRKALYAFGAAHELLKNHEELELVAIEMRNGINKLNELLGQDLSSDDVLDVIFSRFCIGK